VKNNNNGKNNYNNPQMGSFLITSMDLWQQSSRAWIEAYKEVAVSSQKVYNSWSDTVWKTLGARKDQRIENQSYSHHDDMYKKNNNKKKIRSLVLQGGGTLGAFQAGAFKALYEKLTKEDIQNGNEGKPLFDIVAGTSIGAINAAILVSHVVENKTWVGSAEKLVEFWEYLSCPTPDITKDSAAWKKEFEKNNENNEKTVVASPEAARRYYSVKEFLKSGVDKAYSPILPPKEDEKFFDSQNKRTLYDKHPLQKSLEKFAKFPIATNYEKGQPRLLVVSTDVAEGKAVTFDSYEKDKDHILNDKETRKTVYEGSDGKQIVIEYDQGINIQHVMASASLPEFYEYEKINGREFWDGGILSNTPIRELIQAHKEFWQYKIGSKELEDSILNEANLAVPDLEIYLVNLWHSNDNNSVPYDPDGITERHLDIKSHDQYYVNESILVTQYIHLIKKLLQLGNNKEKYNLKNQVNKILEDYTTSRHTTEKPNKYLDIIKAQFEITKLETIERRDDIDTVAGKIGDFTSETIKKLIKEGYESTRKKYPHFVFPAAKS
jgi:NTE family protein